MSKLYFLSWVRRLLPTEDYILEPRANHLKSSSHPSELISPKKQQQNLVVAITTSATYVPLQSGPCGLDFGQYYHREFARQIGNDFQWSFLKKGE